MTVNVQGDASGRSKLIVQTLKTTVPLVSYIRKSLRFWYYASLSTCCQNLEKKNWGNRENLGESGGQTFNPPGTKGFGTHTKHQGGVEKDPPPVSQEREMLQT